MKVEIPAKRGASRDKKRGDNRSKMQTDITVTVKNEKDSSIEKAPVAAPIGHSSRTIVRLNTKTGTTKSLLVNCSIDPSLFFGR